jgi:hypothetical protein
MVQRPDIDLRWIEIQERAAVAKAQLFPESINVMTPETNKPNQSSQDAIDLITPKQTIQEKSIVNKETQDENANDSGYSNDDDGKPAAVKRNVSDNVKNIVNNDDNDDDDTSNDNDTDIENKPKVGKRELEGLMFSKHYGQESLHILDPHLSDKNQRSTRKKLQINEKGVAHGKLLREYMFSFSKGYECYMRSVFFSTGSLFLSSLSFFHLY